MIDLENLIALGGSSIKYKHNFPLPNEQSMWCNYGFEGPLSVGSVRTDHPYIDYTPIILTKVQIIHKRKIRVV